MKYSTAIIVLVILFIASLVAMYVFRGDKKVLTRKLLRMCLILILISTIVGMLGLLYGKPVDFFSTLGLLVAVMACFGLYAWWYWTKRQLADLDEKAIQRWEIPQALAITFFATAAILHALWATEIPRYNTSQGVMLLVAPATFVLMVPPLVMLAFRYYNRIPVVAQYYDPWILSPLDAAPVIEPTADSKRIYFRVPVSEKSSEIAAIDVSAPNEEQLRKIFHHILYRYNVKERRHPRIDVAFENKKGFMYGWLLYRIQPRWYWWDKKIYLDLAGKVRFADILDGESVFAERTRPWENKYLK